MHRKRHICFSKVRQKYLASCTKSITLEKKLTYEKTPVPQGILQLILPAAFSAFVLYLSENNTAMITIKPIIVHGNRRKDGTWPVVMRVTYRGVSRRVATPLCCTSADLTRSLHIKTNTDIYARAEAIAQSMREAVADLSPFDLAGHDVDWVVQRIRTKRQEMTFSLDFFAWANSYIPSKEKSTQRTYYVALNAFARFLGKNEIDINEITKTMLQDFMSFIDAEPRMYWDAKAGRLVPSSKPRIPRGASTRNLAKLEHLYNAAKDRYNDEDAGRVCIPRNPFKGIQKYFPPSNGPSCIGVEVMQRVINARVDNACIRLSLDVFIVSFCCMGVNMADLWAARSFEGEWKYYRQKTTKRRSDRAEMRVQIPEQAEPFLSRLTGKGEWWLNRLHAFTSGGKDYASLRVNRYLCSWCEAEGIERFTFGAARHTWATLARRCGVDKSTIDDCLAHKGDYHVTDIYAERAWHLMTEANKKVLSLFAWERS